MDTIQPIYTKPAQCQDCYKCLRQCSVKAIKIHEGHARIEPDLCVMCGHCVKVCPVQAKAVRSDIERAKMLLGVKEKVLVSLAPSYVTEFAGCGNNQIISAIKKLGFFGVSETALGAQELSAAVAEKIAASEKKIFISSACPTVVELTKKYYPQYADLVMDMYSPVLVHTKLLRREYGDDIGIVFVGPCIAKKTESDLNNDLLNVTLTFAELRQWFQQAGIDPNALEPNENEIFIPSRAQEGAMYPVDGGMIAGIKANCAVNNLQFMSFSGIKNIQKVMNDLDQIKIDGPLFIELLACEGGCVNGPVAGSDGKTALKRFQIIGNTEYNDAQIPRKASVDVNFHWPIPPVAQIKYSEDEIRAALEKIGKYRIEDELNCGGCGYDACRAFAEAMLDGRAEANMCVGYMRQLAHKKAAALLRSMPSGVVIVDSNLQILECNRRFAEILGKDNVLAFQAKPGMEGAHLKKVMDFHQIFSDVLHNSVDIEKDVKLENAIIHVTVFTIEPGRLVGGIIRDITEPSVQKERIIEKARQVIEKNLSTVQKIAYLLGENAAESEVILNSIVKSFMTESADNTDGKTKSKLDNSDLE